MSKQQTLRDLCDAATRGDVDAAQAALEQGAKVNGRAEYGKTPVMFAIQNGHIPMIRFLKSKGARLNMLDEELDHAMIYAFTNGGISIQKDGKEKKMTQVHRMEVVRELLSLGADPRSSAADGKPALHYAAYCFNGKQLVELIQKGMNILPIDADEDYDQTFLHAVAQSSSISESDAALLIKLSVEQGVDINAKTATGFTAVFQAKLHKKSHLEDMLIAAGATPHSFNIAPQKRLKPR
jgi:hypothetical protein